MRKFNDIKAVMPIMKNEFIYCIENGTEVIVLNCMFLEELDKELKEDSFNRKISKFYKASGKFVLLTALISNPVSSVIVGTLSLLIGKAYESDIKEYKTYKGYNINGNKILVLVHKKKVDKKYDRIIFNENYVSKVSKLSNTNLKNK